MYLILRKIRAIAKSSFRNGGANLLVCLDSRQGIATISEITFGKYYRDSSPVSYVQGGFRAPPKQQRNEDFGRGMNGRRIVVNRQRAAGTVGQGAPSGSMLRLLGCLL